MTVIADETLYCESCEISHTVIFPLILKFAKSVSSVKIVSFFTKFYGLEALCFSGGRKIRPRELDQTFEKHLTFGLKMWYTYSIVLADILSVTTW